MHTGPQVELITKKIVIDFKPDADPVVIDTKPVEFADAIYNWLLPYGIERVYVESGT